MATVTIDRMIVAENFRLCTITNDVDVAQVLNQGHSDVSRGRIASSLLHDLEGPVSSKIDSQNYEHISREHSDIPKPTCIHSITVDAVKKMYPVIDIHPPSPSLKRTQRKANFLSRKALFFRTERSRDRRQHTAVG